MKGPTTMTDVSTEGEETESSAPWPVPEGTRLADKAWDLLGSMLLEAEELEVHLDDLVTSSPVRRDPEHPVYLHDLARVIDTLEKAQDRLKEVRAIADEAFCRGLPMGTSNVSFADTRPMVPRFGGERKEWANDLLQADVKPRLLMADLEAGEARTPSEVLEATLSVVSLNGGNVKVTGLRHLGLDPDDYCKKVPKAPAVQVVK